jgi:hypothetical protein
MSAFIDVEGAFDNTGFGLICQLPKGGIIIRMLECQIVRSRLGIKQVTIRTTRACPQWSVLLPLLWSLVINKLLTDLDSQVYELFGFMEIVILVRGKVDSVLLKRMQTGLN